MTRHLNRLSDFGYRSENKFNSTLDSKSGPPFDFTTRSTTMAEQNSTTPILPLNDMITPPPFVNNLFFFFFGTESWKLEPSPYFDQHAWPHPQGKVKRLMLR